MQDSDINLNIWKRLRKKWTKLDVNGHLLKIDFKLITNGSKKDKTFAVDIVQIIDDDIIVDTVQRRAGEAYSDLGIAGLSLDELKIVYKEMMAQACHRLEQPNHDLVIIMSPTSETSGEVRGYLQSHDEPVKQAILTNYQHYYVLNALRERMTVQVGQSWKQVKAVYKQEDAQFYFEY